MPRAPPVMTMFFPVISLIPVSFQVSLRSPLPGARSGLAAVSCIATPSLIWILASLEVSIQCSHNSRSFRSRASILVLSISHATSGSHPTSPRNTPRTWFLRCCYREVGTGLKAPR
jgi:hypothetical protein